MSEELESQPQQPQVQVDFDDSDIRTTYINAYRIHTAPEEVVLDLGFNMTNPAKPVQPGQPPAFLFKISDRMIMSYSSAKRLAMSLGQLIKRYEQQFGEVPVQPGARR